MTRKTNARLAGIMFLLYIVTGVAGMAIFGPATRGETTAEKLTSVRQHETLVRSAAVFSLVMMVNPFVLGAALYALTRDVDRDLALLALMFRVTEGIVAAVSALPKRALLSVAEAATSANSAESAAALSLGGVLLSLQGLTTLIAATTFAIGSTLFAWLFLRARSIPLWLAWLGVVASVLLVIVLPLQIAGAIGGAMAMYAWIPMAAFEVIFAVWLLFKVPSTTEA